MTSAAINPEGRIQWYPEVTEVTARFVDASNVTLLGRTTDGVDVIYKPIAGERPLHDFTTGTLAEREALTFELSRVMGLGVVPDTVVAPGPYGAGAVQRVIPIDEDFDPLGAVRAADPELWPIALLDLVANNADRKLGHMIRHQQTGALYGVDHGLTFHPDDKLRTLLWGFAGMPIPDEFVAAIQRAADAVAGWLGEDIASTLGEDERTSLERRILGLFQNPSHPHPPDDRPPIPWPPY